MGSLPQLDYGLLIAFFFPGFVGLYAFSYLSQRIAQVFDAVLSKDQSVGASFLVLVGSLIVGMVLSSIRALVLDWLHDKTGAAIDELDYSKLSDKEKLAAFQQAIVNTYRYYQFYGNMVLSLLLLAVIRFMFIGFGAPHAKTLWAVNLLAMVVLFVHSRYSRRDTNRILHQILAGDKDAGQEASKEKD